GGDDRDERDPSQRNLAIAGDPRRNWTWHEHLRRNGDRAGGRRVSAQPAGTRGEDALRDALPRTGGASAAPAAGAQLQRRRSGGAGTHRLRAADRAGRGGPELWGARRGAGGTAEGGRAA